MSFGDSIHAAHAINVKARAEGCRAWCEPTTRHLICDWDGVNDSVALIRLAVHLRAGLLKILMPSLLTLLFGNCASFLLYCWPLFRYANVSGLDTGDIIGEQDG
jgi:hypothetical protein